MSYKPGHYGMLFRSTSRLANLKLIVPICVRRGKSWNVFNFLIDSYFWITRNKYVFDFEEHRILFSLCLKSTCRLSIQWSTDIWATNLVDLRINFFRTLCIMSLSVRVSANSSRADVSSWINQLPLLLSLNETEFGNVEKLNEKSLISGLCICECYCKCSYSAACIVANISGAWDVAAVTGNAVGCAQTFTTPANVDKEHLWLVLERRVVFVWENRLLQASASMSISVLSTPNTPSHHLVVWLTWQRTLSNLHPSDLRSLTFQEALVFHIVFCSDVGELQMATCSILFWGFLAVDLSSLARFKIFYMRLITFSIWKCDIVDDESRTTTPIIHLIEFIFTLRFWLFIDYFNDFKITKI